MVAAEFTLTTDAPRSILLVGEGADVAKEALHGDWDASTKTLRVDFTRPNALTLRRFLTGRMVEIAPKDRQVLAFLADKTDDETDLKKYVWSAKLIDLVDKKLKGKYGSVKTEWDLLHYLPYRFIDKSNPQHVDELSLGEWGVIIGVIVNDLQYDYYRDMLKVVVQDITGKRIAAPFFRQKWLPAKFKREDEVVLYGKYNEYRGRDGGWYKELTNASMDKILDVRGQLPMIPIYPQRSGDTTSRLQTAVTKLLDRYVWFEDPVPTAILERFNLMSRNEAYRKLHFPKTREEAQRARERIAFDEFIRLQVFFRMRRFDVAEAKGRIKDRHALRDRFMGSLPFEFTGAQQRVIAEIGEDLASPHPMYRLLQGDVGSGKAQDLNSLVLTPNGFRKMGELTIGDMVVTPNGGTTSIEGVYPQGVRPIYEFTFGDGTKARADLNHLWSVRTTTAKHRGETHKILRTEELINDLKNRNGSSKWYIDSLESAAYGSAWPLDISPYTFGVILGDGSTGGNQRSLSLTVGEAGLDIIDLLNSETPSGFAWEENDYRTNPNTGKKTYRFLFKKQTPIKPVPPAAFKEVTASNVQALVDLGYSLTAIRNHMGVSSYHIYKVIDLDFRALQRSRDANIALSNFRDLGIIGHTAAHKFVPEALMNSDQESRLALLQGLLDTDGSVEQGKAFSFTSVSLTLAENVADLTRSLGGKARTSKTVRKSGISYRTYGRVPSELVPFRLQKKRLAYESMPDRAAPSKPILSIDFWGNEEAQCIKLADPNGLYVTDGFTVTHNTEISTTAALTAVDSGYQVGFLAPTDILASQLYDRLRRDLERAGLEVECRLLVSKGKPKERAEILAGMKSGAVDIVVGTHAIIQPGVEFKDLGLVVIDEQHKFGTEQRSLLRDANETNGVPDMLAMSATPIPRTTAQVVYGDMDVSIVDELPLGRQPIQTEWLEEPEPAWERIREQVAMGYQAYVVTALVEDSEVMENVESATSTHEMLSAIFPDLNVGLLHGRLDQKEKEAVIGRFYAGETQVLVSTTVVEVGVNVPNATVMTILNANRFGIASLHQIRGRVGRGNAQSYCYLIGTATNGEAVERLTALTESTDGFWLAEKDLEIRGEGALMGDRQSGQTNNFVGNLREHREILDIAQRVAKAAYSSVELQAETHFLYDGRTVSA